VFEVLKRLEPSAQAKYSEYLRFHMTQLGWLTMAIGAVLVIVGALVVIVRALT